MISRGPNTAHGRGTPVTVGGFLSSESTAGSYNSGAYTWTPGRGSDGRITQTSYDLVPTGVWVAIGDTGFASKVQPLLTAALPSYNDPGSSDLSSVLNAYNGFAHDVVGGRLFAHGGGHQDGANNGIYRLDLAKMMWSIAKLPDDNANWPANYKTNPPRDNSYTIYTNALDYCAANSTTTDAGYDEFYDTGTPLANTRNPTARHTYAAMTFAGGKLRHGVRRYWEWDEGTGEWTRAYPHGKNYTTHKQAGGGYCGEAVKGTWDEVNSRYIVTPTQISSVPLSGWAWNTVPQTWSIPTNLLSGWEAYAAAFARRGREWCSFARPTRNGDFWPASIKVWNLDTEAITTVGLTGLTQSRCIDNSKFDESTVMAYCPDVGQFLALMPYDRLDAYGDTANLPLEPFWIDTSAGTITYEAQSGAFPALTSTSLVKNKFVYVAQLKALLLVQDASSSVLIRKF